MSIVRCLLVCICVPGLAWAAPLTLPVDRRPAWLAEQGIVMAGSWEPLPFRVRRDGSSGYVPTPAQREDYVREHSPAMIARLKAMGVNFVMMHCYKGGGLEFQKESMADAVRFAGLCHRANLRVGVYNYSGAFLWELFFKEVPEAKGWVVRNEQGNPVIYEGAPYRYYWNRNHPEAQRFYGEIVRFAVQDIQADLIHFDNYVVGPGWDANSRERFHRYVREAIPPERLAAAGIVNPGSVEPPKSSSAGLLQNAWSDFSCQSLAESYSAMNRYARSLRPDVLLECNPNGVEAHMSPPVDHGRLLQGGEAYWDESSPPPGYHDGLLNTRIRSFKVARATDNMVFSYITTPLEAAESMAFNLDCLGAICWFEYAQIVDRPAGKNPVSPKLDAYVRFYHRRHGLLSNCRVVADAAVLRSFPSQVFGGPASWRLTAAAEDALIRNRACFQILHDHQLDDLHRCATLILAGCGAWRTSRSPRFAAMCNPAGVSA